MADERRIGGGTRLAGVIGWPVEHSRSPQMHNAAYAALGMDWAYVAMPVEPARLEQALRGAAALGFAGLNVTIPHKQATAAICAELSPEARRADSANTVLMLDGGRLRGETTDGQGMLDAIGVLPGPGALVLGAGGAARAAVAALAGAGLAVTVSARRREAAERLAQELGATVTDWPARDAPELIVNATPLGQAGEAAQLPLDAGLLDGRVVCDLAYRGDGAETGLIASARERGARAVDGLEVLVGQGALAFRLFTGAEPPIEIMRAAVRNATIA
ncbi:MAG TPA: shikimate dehydrogenase [Gaiellales bacterium]|nr:shikimate dehydrogenase [Gaiellales bacterium]